MLRKFHFLIFFILTFQAIADDSNNSSNNDNNLDMTIAAENGHAQRVKVLIESGVADKDWKNDRGKTALMLAAGRGHVEVLKVLVDKGASIDLIDLDGDSALGIAVKKSRKKAVHFLIEKNANILLKNLKKKTPFSIAAFGGKTPILEIMLKKGIPVDTRDADGSTSLIDCSRLGRITTVKLLLEYKADVNAKDKHGLTSLDYAKQNKHVSIIHALEAMILRKGYETPLMRAAMAGEISKVLNLILKENAEVNFKSEKGFTALMGAAFKGHIRIVKLLIKHGADVTIKAKNGKTAFDYAKDGGFSNICQIIRHHDPSQYEKKMGIGLKLFQKARDGHIAVSKMKSKKDIEIKIGKYINQLEDEREILKKLIQNFFENRSGLCYSKKSLDHYDCFKKIFIEISAADKIKSDSADVILSRGQEMVAKLKQSDTEVFKIDYSIFDVEWAILILKQLRNKSRIKAILGKEKQHKINRIPEKFKEWLYGKLGDNSSFSNYTFFISKEYRKMRDKYEMAFYVYGKGKGRMRDFDSSILFEYEKRMWALFLKKVCNKTRPKFDDLVSKISKSYIAKQIDLERYDLLSGKVKKLNQEYKELCKE